MSLSIQTNVTSMIAQENLRVNSDFQSQTIERLTSGYRINHSGDDAAGLVIANEYRSSVAELTQGVRNANDGVSQLQIVDGGLNNISQILDRMKTLATQSASTTFTGDRTTLNNEFSALVQEINRQAANVGLTSGGSNNTVMNIYIGGGNVQSNSEVNIDLSGGANQVDATGLGLSGTSLLAGGTTFGSVNLNNVAGGVVLAAGASGSSQAFTLNLANGSQVALSVASTSAAGITVTQAVSQLNQQLSPYGISASVDQTTGDLVLSGGNTAFSITSAAATNASTGLVAAADKAINTGMYRVDSTNAGTAPVAAYAGVAPAASEALTFTVGSTSVGVTLTNANAGNMSSTLSTLNTALNPLGINAIQDINGGVAFESTQAFSVTKGNSQSAGVFALTGVAGAFTDTGTAPAAGSSTTSNSLQAITALDSAIKTLGLVQGRVGAGENTLNYAISLAQNQISNFSGAESRIRDADVAAEAANLTKAQVLQQASMAALAQANAAPQAVLALLRG